MYTANSFSPNQFLFKLFNFHSIKYFSIVFLFKKIYSRMPGTKYQIAKVKINIANEQYTLASFKLRQNPRMTMEVPTILLIAKGSTTKFVSVLPRSPSKNQSPMG